MADDCAPASLPPRRRDTHKGTYGHVLVIGGSRGMIGAAALCAHAAARSGAGLVTAACPESERSILAAKLTSAMTVGLEETKAGTIAAKAVDRALDWSRRVQVVALGPGLSRAPSTADFLRSFLSQVSTPVVIDADGLNGFEGASEIQRAEGQSPVLTPHPGELATLLELSVPEIQANREQVARKAAAKFQCVMVLKGCETITTDGDRVAINGTGNPGMATGGTGDVLTGMIAGLLAQGFGEFDSARLAVYVHGDAGDRAAKVFGETSLVAEDLLCYVPVAFSSLDGPPLPFLLRDPK